MAELQTAPDAFQLVITDLDMPGMNGIEFRRAIRLFAPELQVILATGSTFISEDEAHLQGFFGLIRKPSSMAVLREIIKQLGLPTVSAQAA